MNVRVQTLGDVRVFADEAELADLPRQRLRSAFLIILAVQREITREELATLLWPERTDERARQALKQTLYELRRTLGDDLVDSQGDRLRINSGVSADLQDLEEAISKADHERALALYRGSFLDHFFLPESKSFESWVDVKRGHYVRLHRAARRSQISALAAAGKLQQACDATRRWIELEPLEDEAHHRLIELLNRAGGRAQALEQYDQYVRLLAAEELEPLDETKALALAVRQGTDAPVGSELKPRSQPPQNQDPPHDGAPVRRWSARVVAVAAAAILLVTFSTGWFAWVRPALMGRHIRTIAVLPFENRSANKQETDYRCDGLTEALINALTQIQALRVPARTSSFVFKNVQRDVRRIGRELDVQAVVEGSCRVEGSRLHVTANLINTKDGYGLWSKGYDKELREIFEMQDEIVRAIVHTSALELEASEAARLATRPTENLEAYDLYQKGVFYLNTLSRDSLSKAIDYFKAATKVDTTFALAYAGLVDVYHVLITTRVTPRTVVCPQARQAALRAMALDSSLAEVHNSVARHHWGCDDDIRGAEKEFLRGIELNPNLAAVHSNYGMMLAQVEGRFEEGINQSRIARKFDPLSALGLVRAANVFRAARLFDSAVALYRRAREIDPASGNSELNLAKSYLATGRWQEAGALLDTTIAGDRNSALALGYRAYIHARYGQRGRALEIFSQLEDMSLRQSVSDGVAVLQVGLGDHESALRALEKAAVTRPPNLRLLLGEQVLDPLRENPRFVRILDQLDMPHLTVRQRDSLTAKLMNKPWPRPN